MPETPTRPEPFVPATHRRVPQHLARRFAQICNTLLSEVATPYGLMSWHMALLVQVRETPGMDRGWLATAIGADATSTGKTLESFVSRGFATRSAKLGDLRAATFTLTPAGNALFDKMKGPTRAVARHLLSPLSETEAETLLDLLARLVDAHEAHARSGAGRRRPRRHSDEDAALNGPESMLAAAPLPDEGSDQQPRTKMRQRRVTPNRHGTRPTPAQ